MLFFGGIMSGFSNGEVRICGAPQAFGAELAIGRLRFFGGEDRDGEGRIVCFRSAGALGEAILLKDESFLEGIAAAVCTVDVPDRLLGALSERGTPYFILPDAAALSPSLEGRLALLDGRRGELIIDPQIETLCGYTADRSGAAARSRAKKSRFYKSIPNRNALSSGVLCECVEIGRGGDLFERASSLAELLCSSSLAVLLDVPQGSDEEAEKRFCDSAEALLRAAVYGNMSLILGGVCSQAEAGRAFGLLHSCFCGLLEEGREFNGYIAKGILVSSPTLLLDASHLPRCDLLCLDFSRLSYLLTGARGREGLARSREALRGFWEDWRRDNEALCRSRELRAICRAEDADDFFWDWVEFMDISEVYLEDGYNDGFCDRGSKNS